MFNQTSPLDIQVKFGGEAGEGIMVTGLTFSKICLRQGFFVFDYTEYPSLIRGGHNSYQVRINNQRQVFSQKGEVDMLVSLNQETIDLHKDELVEGAYVVYDAEKIDLSQVKIPKSRYRMAEVPVTKILGDLAAPKVVSNSVFLGSVVALLQLDLLVLQDVLRDTFEDKGEKIVAINQKAARAGFEWVKARSKAMKTHLPTHPQGWSSEKSREEGQLLMTGNEAVALGAIVAGCQAYFAYPMTPSSSILHFLAQEGPQYGMVVKQPEDEIAVINMAIGASFVGVRAMVATSGGGFCLMTEGLGLSGMTETPLVVVLAQRPGPATGLPTWTEQGDLRFALHAHQGDFPRIILAPGDVEEAFSYTVEAFNLADRYQLSVIVLMDKYLSESHQSVSWKKISGDPEQEIGSGGQALEGKIDRGAILEWEKLEEIRDYKRYQLTGSGVSPRTLPGQEGGIFRANSDEHDEYGFSEESLENRVKMLEKRMRKLKAVRKEMSSPILYGPPEAEVTLVGWGSTKGPILEALRILSENDSSFKINFLHLNWIWPFPKEEVAKTLFMSRRTLVIEGNFSAQLHGLIKEQTGHSCNEELLKYDGRPFYPGEIVDKIRSSRS